MENKTLTVTQFNALINEMVSVFPVVVEGEVSNYRDIPGRNFVYFDIKDENAVAKCFQGFWHSQKVELENGSQIKVYGIPNLQKNGSLVIDVREISLVGEGALMQNYLKLKEKLSAEGIFDDAHKKPLPIFPEKVGLIAGKNSSAYHDVTAEIKERWGGCDVLFLAAKVQGMYAKKEVTEAIRFFNQKKPVDVLIVARGGGSLEELQAFDSEEVVREMFASKIPVISAIGHEDHWTLSDFVSDIRAKTPTKAAQICVPDKKEIVQRLEYFSEHSNIFIKRKLEQKKAELENFDSSAKAANKFFISKAKDELARQGQVAKDFVLEKVEDFSEKLEGYSKVVELLNPQNILKKGFCVVEKNGRRISSVAQLKEGDSVTTTLQNGQFDSTINRKHPTK